jgi:hypothetical protein
MVSAAPLLLAAWLGTTPPGPTNGADEEEPATVAEEAKAGAAISPVELIPRLELRQSFVQLHSGAAVHATTTEIDIQFLERLLLRYEGTIQVLRAPTGQVSGFGDAEISAVVLVATDPRYVVAVVGGAILNTASQPPLGAGKQQIVVGAAAAVKPVRWWLPYLLVQQQVSVAGDANRPDVNQLVARLGNIVFGPGYAWLKLDLDTAVDFEERAGRFFGRLEAGRLLVGRVGLFMRGGTQLLGTRDIDYSFEVGVRYLFRLGRP